MLRNKKNYVGALDRMENLEKMISIGESLGIDDAARKIQKCWRTSPKKRKSNVVQKYLFVSSFFICFTKFLVFNCYGNIYSIISLIPYASEHIIKTTIIIVKICVAIRQFLISFTKLIMLHVPMALTNVSFVWAFITWYWMKPAACNLTKYNFKDQFDHFYNTIHT